jgi:hypothetical protein
MYLDEWNSLNQSLIDHPPTDLLVAAYLGYKSPIRDAKNLRDAGRANSDALNSPLMSAAMPKARMKTIDQMPEYVRSPAKMALIAKMKAEMGMGEANGFQ